MPKIAVNVLEKIGRAEEGLTALLDILVRVPDSAEAHTLARGLAARLGKAATYLETVTGAADKLRRADDSSCLADLLFPAADVVEDQLGDVGVVADDDEHGRRDALGPGLGVGLGLRNSRIQKQSKAKGAFRKCLKCGVEVPVEEPAPSTARRWRRRWRRSA